MITLKMTQGSESGALNKSLVPSCLICSCFAVILVRISSKEGRSLGFLLVHLEIRSLRTGCGISSGTVNWD